MEQCALFVTSAIKKTTLDTGHKTKKKKAIWTLQAIHQDIQGLLKLISKNSF